MVLFKRKPVRYVNKPIVESDETEVWQIPQTGEIFVDYEAYLNRMDFYKQRRFICQITGHSGLSFFEALKSELAGAQEVEEAFPEALKGPILRRVQFQTISRIDTLVDLIFEEYRCDYYPGEAVTVHVLTGERITGTVRDKTRFGSKLLPDGRLSAPFSRYFVSLDNRPTEEAVVDDAHITRDRKIFTKQVLRSFIKKTVTREAWTGAPWLVKPEVAAQYHIDTRVPPHLRYESKAAERKANQQQKKAGAPDFEGMVGIFLGTGPQARLPELKPAPKSHKSKTQQGAVAKAGKQQPFLNPAPMNPNPPQFQTHPQPPYLSHTFQANGPPPPPGPHYAQFHNGQFAFAPLASLPPPPPPPPPIKYPIEDLHVYPRFEPPIRPALKFFSQDVPGEEAGKTKEGNGILMKSVGLLLETWDTLNVYCQVFILDSFTFDDFVDALQFTSEDVECQLFVEMHCAALKMLVDSEAHGGRINAQLPDMEDEEEEEDEEDAKPTAPPTPEPEPEPLPKKRATRASLAKAEAESIKVEPVAVKEPTPGPKESHRAAEMQIEVGWVERLRKRDFNDGGWQIIVVGLVHQLSKTKNPRHAAACEALLKELAPLNMEPTKETARVRYATLDINLRIQALQLVVMLTVTTKPIRKYMEDSSDHMTRLRKEKIQWQRDRKQYLEELRLLNEERKIQLPANMPPSPVPETKHLPEDVKMSGAEEEIHDSNGDETIDTDEEVQRGGRSLRRGNDRAAERKRKREVEQEKKVKAEARAKVPKQTKQFMKLLKGISDKQAKINECEREIATLDSDLREADCPRTRVLGKDRFWNRYYWFERNGMPLAGLPESSTYEAARYANGCIWVQGPDDIEREGYIDVRPEWQHEYKTRFNMTIPERKKLEEGATSVYNANQWGYYDDPEAVNGLLEWLDNRGINEIKLKKEMLIYKDRIIENMEMRKKYLSAPREKSVESDAANQKHMLTRKRNKETHGDHTAHRCLQWKNSMAVKGLKHLHSEEPRPRKQTKKSSAILPPGYAYEYETEERQTRSEAKGKKSPEVEEVLGKRKKKSSARRGGRYREDS